MIKYIGIFILSCSISLYGAVLSNILKEKHAIKKEITILLKKIERSILYNSKSCIDTVRQCNLPMLEKSGFCKNFSGCDDANIVINTHLSILDAEDRNMLCEFFSKLGKSSFCEYELKNLKYCLDYFEKSLADSEKNVNTKVILYKKIGLLAGILAAIIFI